MAAILAPEVLTSSLLVVALTNRLTRSQFLRLILPDESMIKAISTTALHSLSVKWQKIIFKHLKVIQFTLGTVALAYP